MLEEPSDTHVLLEPGMDVSTRAYGILSERIDLPKRTRALGLDRSTRDEPVVLPGSEVAHNGGTPWRDDLSDVFAWILPEAEMEAFSVQAEEADDEWGGFVTAAFERQRSGRGGNLCLAMGTTKGVMEGFLELKRGMLASSRTDVSYHFTFDRAYLLPRARGSGLAAGLVALASLVASEELHHVAKAIAPARGKAALWVYLNGEAESAGGEWMLRSLTDEFEDICERIDEGHNAVRIAGLELDIERYEPDEDSARRPDRHRLTVRRSRYRGHGLVDV